MIVSDVEPKESDTQNICIHTELPYKMVLTFT